MNVAFLRGMNLGRRRITNAALQQVFRQLGYTDVSTYRASGNVLFRGNPDEAMLSQGLQRELGYEVLTFVRTPDQLRAIVDAGPFTPGQLASTLGKHQVTLLAAEPSDADKTAVLGHGTDDDRLVFGERALHWLPRAGVSDSELDHRAIERVLGLGTTRTLGTLRNIARKLG